MKNLTTIEFLSYLKELDVQLQAENESLSCNAPDGVLTDVLRGEISNRKNDILQFLNNNKIFVEIEPNQNQRFDPFPLTEIQQAYWVGRGQSFELGGVAAHGYLEFENKDDLDLSRLEWAWQQVIKRHDMMRMIILSNGQQQVLEEVPEYKIEIKDLKDNSQEEIDLYIQSVRDRMSHQVIAADAWPLFEVNASQFKDSVRLHVSLDLLVSDLLSVMHVFEEWFQLYLGKIEPQKPLDISFRDYVDAVHKLYDSPLYTRSREYWFDKIPTLPPAPEIPLIKSPSTIGAPKFGRHSGTLTPERWEALKHNSKKSGITPSNVVLAAFNEVMTLWSRNPEFTINVTLFNRLPIHPQINELVGDFTTTLLLAVNNSEKASFKQRVLNQQQQLWNDLDYKYVNGVEVIREIANRSENRTAAIMPVVFTSALGLDSMHAGSGGYGQFGELVYGISQTPQVWLDQQIMEQNGSLVFNWDSVDELFPEGLLDDMFDAYSGLLERLADDEKLWDAEQVIQVPALQAERKETVNNTNAEVSTTLLHELFNQQISQHSQSVAIVDGENKISYQALYEISNRIGHCLKNNGAQTNELIAVVMEKGWQQVAGVLGVLNSGAAYLPLDPNLPEARLHSILASAKVKTVLTQTEQQTNINWPDGISVYSFEDDAIQTASYEALVPVQQVDDLAYVIYTSGSTGQPKGVMIDHQGAVNTLIDMNERFNITADDKVLGISSLSFDLSVYDVFGILSAGGTLVLPAKDQLKDASHWLQLIQKHNITLWNSVPALMQMLVEYSGGKAREELGSIKNIWMSGDWIPLDLPDRIKALWPKCNVTSLGGATEASIWSIHYPIEQVSSDWSSIPYGKPLKNQQFYVLDSQLNICPDWVPGELYIGGIGVAKGYWQDEEKTNASFISHPQTKERLYKTGDLGRYLNDGNIEFLGREDFQVKVNGYRIELGEIEAAINQHVDVQESVVTAYGEDKGNKQLVAYIVSNEQGKTEADVKDYQPQLHNGVLMDPLERLAFKLKQPGIRHYSTEQKTIALEQPADMEDKYLSRQSYREFSQETLSLTQFSRFISCLSQLQIKELPLPKYRYPSAGSLYPVQNYIYVRAGKVEDIEQGLYYHNPVKSELVLIEAGECVQGNAYGANGGTNRDIFEQCGFGIYLVGDLTAIEPLYGEWSRDFCIIEAGYIGQMLSEAGPEENIGVCAIGDMDYEMIAAPFELNDKQIFVHSFLAGHVSDEQMKNVPILSKPVSLEKNLERYLDESIPMYMVPKIYIELDALPLTSNGKIDRKALPIPDGANVISAVDYVEPESDIEKILAGIIEEVVQIKEVGINHNFFELGANSVGIVQINAILIEEHNIEIPIVYMFQYPTIKYLADYISNEGVIEKSYDEIKERANKRKSRRRKSN